MQKFVPLEKQSKKAQAEHHKKQRNTWGAMNPATRVVPNSKTYNRKRQAEKDGPKGLRVENTTLIQEQKGVKRYVIRLSG